MRKFSKILESIESDISKDIKDIFIDFMDMGFTIKIDEIESHFSISLTCDHKVDTMECVRDLLVADERLGDINLECISSKSIILYGEKAHYKSQIEIRYKLKDVTPTADNIKTWDQFKSYCENVLGIDGIHSDDFRIEVFGKHNWLDSCPAGYEGFYIDFGGDFNDPELYERKKQELISLYPRYREFFDKYLEYRVDWNLVHKQDEWKDRDDKITPKFYPIPFNKEGIEVVKKLIEITS